MWLDELYHALDPIAFSLGPVTVRWYGLGYLLGFVAAGIIMYRYARHWGIDFSAEDSISVMCGISLGIIIGARVGYVLFYGPFTYYLAHPLETFAVWEGGMSFHGGLCGAIVGGVIACKQDGLSIATVSDLVACGAPVGIFFVRCANFVNGELWGKECDLPWAVAFESGGGVFRHPSQLYEAVLEGLVLFCILWALSRRVPARPQGTFMGTFLLWYGICRIAVEFVRVPDAQLGYLFAFVTMGQVLSLPLVVAGCYLLYRAHRDQRPQQARLAPAA